jgi:YD repeat-containing protein
MKATALFLLALMFACPVLAQRGPGDELGFNAQKLYDFSDVDSVNLFNGNLTIVIPLGFRYVVSPNLSYQLNLVFNGKIWDLESYDCQDGTGERCERMLPNLRSNAGLGWRLAIGRLLPPWASSNNSSFERYSWTYEGFSGDEHAFGDWAGASLRLIEVNSTTREVEFPSGEVQKFVLENFDWRLKEIRDRFGNSVNVTYTYAPAPLQRRATKWTITDSVGRSHTVDLEYSSAMAETIDRGMQVKKVTLDGYNNADLVYGLTYVTPTSSSGCGRESATVAPRLSSLSRPDGTSYSFEYDVLDSCYEGTLKKMTLPTRGTVEYTYQGFMYGNPDIPCSTAQVSLETPAIKTRKISDMNGASREWQYVHAVGPIIALKQGADPCWPPGDDYYVGQYWRRTSVLSPLDQNNRRTRTDHYFDIYSERPGSEDSRQTELPGKEAVHYGYPGVIGVPPLDTARLMTWDSWTVEDISAIDDTNDTAPRFLTSQVFDGCDSSGDCTSGTLLQTIYTRYRLIDPGSDRAQMLSTRTVWNGDTGCGGSECYTQVTHSEPNGVGRYKKTKLMSNFSGSAETVSETETDYATWTSTDIGNSAKKWFLDVFTEKRLTANGVTATTKFEFDADTAHLKATRVLKGTGLGPDDVLTLFKRSGNTHQVKSYGGDGGGLSTTSEFAEPGTGLDYLVVSTIVNGMLVRSQYLQPSYEPSSPCTDASQATCVSLVTTADRDFDSNYLLVRTARDVSGVPTDYDYESDGRLKTVMPTGAASLHYAYTNATASANARVVETTKDSNQAIIRSGTYEFDGLGRLKRTSTSLASGNLAVVQTNYDAFGRKYRVSQPVERATHPTTNIGTDWTTFEYDALGRQTKVTGPDGGVTRTAFTGTRKLERTVEDIATSTTGTADGTTTEYYDAEGRLTRVDELAANTSASATTGGVATTTYTYDVGGRLGTVSMTDGTTTQSDRAFDYDNRGFLTSEQHPESGTTTYSNHDARGHALKRTAGGKIVVFAYDAAERLTKVSEQVALNSQTVERPLKAFDFATANVDANLKQGKLETAVRYNRLPSAGEIIVTETYEYATPTGQISKRTTHVQSKSGNTVNDIQEFVLGPNEYDALRQPSKIVMPTCTLHGCTTDSGLTSVTLSRTKGFLTSIPGFATIGYHPSGMVKTVTHSSNPAATDTYDAANELPRPTKITFSGGTECPEIASSPITAPEAVCSNSTANSASVSARSGITHTWQISGGTITSAPTGGSITFTAGASNAVLLTVTASDQCGGAAKSTKTVAINPSPTAVITGVSPPSPVERGVTSSIYVALSGTGPWTISWSDGVMESDLISASHFRNVAPEVTTTYAITSVVGHGNCDGSVANASVTVTVAPPAPVSVTATTIDNRNVAVSWTPVSGATQYRIERAPTVGGGATWAGTVSASITSYTDTVPPTDYAVTYIYYVRTIDSAGTLSARRTWDFATAATQLYEDPQIVPGVTLIKATQIVELRRAIDALRRSVNLSTAFAGADPPSGPILAGHLTEMITALDGARLAIFASPFSYMGMPQPAPGEPIRAAHLQQLRDALK